MADADGTDSLDSTDMLRSLWPATLGYFLNQMMANVFSADVIEQARQYVLANAYPRGPIPAFRVGQTPYGVLPVTSLRSYAVDPKLAGPVETGLVNFVQKLWPTWLASSGGAPQMQRGGDPDQNLMSVLGMDASSMNFQGRPVMGSLFLWNLLGFLGAPQAFQATWWQDFLSPGRALLNNYGYTQWNPRILTLGFGQNSFPIGFSTVQDGPLSETETLNADATLSGGVKGNYINWLQTASVADIQAENYPGTKPTSLLYKILRQSLLLEYANLAGQNEVSAGKLGLAQIQESEMVSVQPRRHDSDAVAGVGAACDSESARFLGRVFAHAELSGRIALRATERLARESRPARELHTAELDRLLTETLDACSHRLDVWATAIANALLEAHARKTKQLSVARLLWLGRRCAPRKRPCDRGRRGTPASSDTRCRKSRKITRLRSVAGSTSSSPSASHGQRRIHSCAFFRAGRRGRGSAQWLHDAPEHRGRRIALDRSLFGARAKGVVAH